ncbi:hypothetical protein CYY_001903 [Polysphondylium violaceum]|uniref:Uncharacterized protein n=1 Tax=Polysphondylium violaceum TaxID=133409 RepID=A0A8J4PZB1_9MYCE|nr:hypothetical protein CYY_001903 [Polysphondylium violaceum]
MDYSSEKAGSSSSKDSSNVENGNQSSLGGLYNSLLSLTVGPVKSIATYSINTFDTTLDSVINFGVEKVPHPEIVDKVVKQTMSTLDTIVDSVLPPPQNEDLDKLTDAELYQLEKRARFLLKLRKRLNSESIRSIPSNSYTALVKSSKENLPTQEYLDKTNALILSIQNAASDKKQKLSQAAIEQLYSSFDTLVATLGSFSIWVKKVDPTEVLVSIQELAKMVKESKERVMNAATQHERVEYFKQDCGKILNRSRELVIEQFEQLKAKADQLRTSDIPIVSQTMKGLETIFLSILNTFTKSLPAPSSSSSTNTTSEQNE